MSIETPLSERELDVLRLVAEGLTNREIAQKLSISHNTVKVHMSNIFEKIGAASRTEATVYAIEHRIVGVPGGEAQAVPVTPGFRELVRQFRWVWLAMLVLLLLTALTVSTNLFTSEPIPTVDVSERWQELAPLPEPRVGMAAVVYGDSVYAIAGEGQNGVSDSVFIYDIQNDSWKTGQQKPTAVSGVDGVLIGEKIFIPGGRGQNGQPTDILEIYDPRTDTWEAGAPMPEKLSSYAMVDYDGFIYLFGGWNGVEPENRVFIYDPSLDNWSEGSPMQSGKYHATAAVSGGEIIVFGGTTDGRDALPITNAYLPSRDKLGEEAWIKMSGFPESLRAPIFGVEEMGDLIILVALVEENTYSFMFYYPQQDEWIISSNVVSELIPVSSSSVSVQGYLYLLGGMDTRGELSSLVTRYQGLFITAFPNISQ